MDQQKIDRLFREKLDSHEVVPSEEAWQSISEQIRPKKRTNHFYWIAASAVLLAVSWVLWPVPPKDVGFSSAESDYPQPFAETEWSLVSPTEHSNPIAEKQTDQTVAKRSKKRKASVTEVENLEENRNVAVQTPVMDLERVGAMASLDLDPGGMIQPVKLEEKATNKRIVKITYIATSGQSATQPKDSVRGFKRLFAIAEKISKVEVLSDIKTAKDEFMNGTLKPKEKEGASL